MGTSDLISKVLGGSGGSSSLSLSGLSGLDDSGLGGDDGGLGLGSGFGSGLGSGLGSSKPHGSNSPYGGSNSGYESGSPYGAGNPYGGGNTNPYGLSNPHGSNNPPPYSPNPPYGGGYGYGYGANATTGNSYGAGSGYGSARPGAPRVFQIKQSGKGPVAIRPEGTPSEAPPMWTIDGNRTSAPNVLMYRGAAEANQVIATAKTDSMTSTKMPFTVRGQPMTMKYSGTSGDYVIQCQLGDFQWKVDQMTGTTLELVDAGGNKLAKHKSSGLPPKKKLEVYVDCDDYLMEIIVVTGIVAKQVQKEIEKAVGKIVRHAVVGA